MIKILLIGDSNVGKTSILLRFAVNNILLIIKFQFIDFLLKEGYFKSITTIGVDFVIYLIFVK